MTMAPPAAVQNLRVVAPGEIAGAKVLWDPVAVPDGATRVAYALRWGPVGTPWGEKYAPEKPDGFQNQLVTESIGAVFTGSGFPVGSTGEVQILALNPDAATSAEKWGPISQPVVFTVFDVVTPEPDPEPEADTEPQPEPNPEPSPTTEVDVELWRPFPWIPTPWGTMALFIGKQLEEEP